jgi:hypothetical protein
MDYAQEFHLKGNGNGKSLIHLVRISGTRSGTVSSFLERQRKWYIFFIIHLVRNSGTGSDTVPSFFERQRKWEICIIHLVGISGTGSDTLPGV